MTGEKIIALTGGTGFAGAHALRALLEDGWRVRMLARDPKRLPPAARGTEKVEVVLGDLEDAEALRALVKGAAAVAHLAGAIKAARREVFHKVNAEGAARLAAIAAEAGVGRFAHVSSLAARAPGLSAYGASKRASEILVLNAAGAGMSRVIVRPPAVYGPGDRATLGLFDQLGRRLALLPGRRDGRVSLLHVTDLAAALALLARTGAANGEILEIDDGTRGGYSWDEMAAIAGRVLGRKARVLLLPRWLVAAAGAGADALSALTGRAFMLSADKARELYHHDWVADSSAMREKTGWRPKLGFAEGFAQTLEWYCDRGWLPEARRPKGAKRRRRSGADEDLEK